MNDITRWNGTGEKKTKNAEDSVRSGMDCFSNVFLICMQMCWETKHALLFFFFFKPQERAEFSSPGVELFTVNLKSLCVQMHYWTDQWLTLVLDAASGSNRLCIYSHSSHRAEQRITDNTSVMNWSCSKAASRIHSGEDVVFAAQWKRFLTFFFYTNWSFFEMCVCLCVFVLLKQHDVVLRKTF